MSDELRRIYAQEGKLHNFFEISVPTDLFRGRKEGSSSPYLLPTLVGWPKRQPDVLLLDAEGGSPQFEGGSVTGEMITEDRKTTPRTAEIMAAAASYTVKGCRTTYPGKHRGVSTFDRPNQALRHFQWIRLPEGLSIPPGIAVTRDVDPSRTKPADTNPLHYTIAPKNDMPLPLFLAHLRGLEARAADV